MPEIVGSYQQGAYATPVDGGVLAAAVVLGNDNNTRTRHNDHDADPGVHLQSSLLAARPAFGSVGRKWLTTDGLRLYYDTGAAWSEVSYVPHAAGVLTAPLVGIAGAAATPSFAFAGDLDTGLFSFAADMLGFAAGGETVGVMFHLGGVSSLQMDSTGTEASPSYSFLGDTSTGIYRPAAAELSVAVGGAEALRVDSTEDTGVSGAHTALFARVWTAPDGGTVRRVHVGAADSGGAGFRLLRVPN